MSTLRELIAPAVVCAVVATLLGLLLYFLLTKRDERKARQFEVRYAEYKKCLQLLDELSAVGRVDFKQAYTGVVAGVLKDMLSDPDQSSDYSLRLDKGLADLATQMRAAFARATGGLHGLGLVCSPGLLALVNEFVDLQRELMEESISVIADASVSNPSASVTEAMNDKARRAHALHDQLLQQMRGELDVAPAAAPER